jgi:hypothetical protein
VPGRNLQASSEAGKFGPRRANCKFVWLPAKNYLHRHERMLHPVGVFMQISGPHTELNFNENFKLT